MDHNPYAPPKASVADAIESVPSELPKETSLYSVRQIAAATFLGSVVAGGWLISANFKVMRLEDQARRAITWSIVGLLAVIGLAMILPDKVPDLAVPIGCVVGVRALAEIRFGKILASHRAAGGAMYSWWRVVGISLLFLAILISVSFVVVMLLYALGIIAL